MVLIFLTLAEGTQGSITSEPGQATLVGRTHQTTIICIYLMATSLC